VIRRRAPLKRSSALKRSTKPIPRKRAKPRRVSVNRDPGYLAFLREEGVCGIALGFTGRSGKGHCDPAHGPLNGRASKGPDNGAVPLCRAHHDEQTRIGWPAFEQKYGFNREREAAAWYAAYLIWEEHTACQSG